MIEIYSNRAGIADKSDETGWVITKLSKTRR